MFPTPFNFFLSLRENLGSIQREERPFVEPEESGFPIHPSASELAEQMLVDPSVLENETYEPGIYDESGDYYPQYTDDPSQLPEHFEPAPLGGDTAPESSPADESTAPPASSEDGKEDS